jgi:hypothetical protein
MFWINIWETHLKKLKKSKKFIETKQAEKNTDISTTVYQHYFEQVYELFQEIYLVCTLWHSWEIRYLVDFKKTVALFK